MIDIEIIPVIELLTPQKLSAEEQKKLDDRLLKLCFSSKYYVEEVKKLIKKGADVNTKNQNGWTPLHLASWNRYLKIVELLIKNGADVNAENKRDKTSLDLISPKREAMVQAVGLMAKIRKKVIKIKEAAVSIDLIKF